MTFPRIGHCFQGLAHLSKRLRVKRWLASFPWLAPMLLWGVFLRHEATYDGFDIGDINAHQSLTFALLAAWKSGSLGLDAWHDGCCLGSAAFRTYQHWGHFLAAALTNLLRLPTPSLALHALLVAGLLLQCPAFFFASRALGFSRDAAAASAWLAPLVATAFHLGHDFLSYVFIGHGLFTQALAVPSFVLTLAYGIRLAALADATRPVHDATIFAFWLCVTFGLHHLYGYLTFLPLTLVGILSMARRWKSPRYLLICVALTLAIFLLVDGYQILSILQDSALLRRSEYDHNSRWDGYGWSVVFQTLTDGTLLDRGRLPVFSFLALGGLGALTSRKARRAVAILAMIFALGLLLVAGRTSLGAKLDWIPFVRFFPLERASILLYLPATFLAAQCLPAVKRIARALSGKSRLASLGCIGLYCSGIAYLVLDRIAFLELNNAEIAAQSEENQHFDRGPLNALSAADRLGNLMFYQTRGFKVQDAHVPYYCIASYFNVPQLSNSFYTNTYGSESVYSFNYGDPQYYRFFNVRGLILPDSISAAPFMTKKYDSGRLSAYEIATPGVFDVIGIPRTFVVRSSEHYLAVIKDQFFRELPRGNNFPSFVPEIIAQHWPQSVPRTASVSSEQPWGEVLSTRRLSSTHYTATLFAQTGGAYGLFRQSFHPRWRVIVNGRRMAPMWGTPGYLVFPLEKGLNHVDLEFPPDPLRRALFLMGMLAFSALPFLLARLNPRRLGHKKSGPKKKPLMILWPFVR